MMRVEQSCIVFVVFELMVMETNDTTSKSLSVFINTIKTVIVEVASISWFWQKLSLAIAHGSSLYTSMLCE